MAKAIAGGDITNGAVVYLVVSDDDDDDAPLTVSATGDLPCGVASRNIAAGEEVTIGGDASNDIVQVWYFRSG